MSPFAQMILTRREPELANTLLLIYLAMFAARTKEAEVSKFRPPRCRTHQSVKREIAGAPI